MSEEIKQIGMRLKGLREALDMSEQEFADSCNIPLGEYQEYESGQMDLTISVLKKIAVTHNVDVSILMFGDEPRMNSYFLTRKGKGSAVQRVECYQYQSLAGGFANRKSEDRKSVV